MESVFESAMLLSAEGAEFRFGGPKTLSEGQLMKWSALVVLSCAVLVCRARAASIPLPTKVVIVIEENHSFSQIIGPVGSAQDLAAPTINSLARHGALMTSSFGVTHPSQPNYLALFSGSTQGITDDNVHARFGGANLGSELIAAGKSFVGYSQGLPSNGSDVASAGAYMRKHNPMTQFNNLAPGGDTSAVNRIFNTANFPTAAGTDYSFLPTVSLVVPDQNNDMHDGSITQGDTWLSGNLGAYQQWAQTHNSLLIVTWDEDNGSSGNRIPTIFFGPMVVPGSYSETINHYNILRTIEDMYGTTHAGNAATVTAITDIWLVPEPGTFLLAAVGAAGLLVLCRQRRFRGGRPSTAGD
jgi:phosphatidylinositol-3-phosphatase